MGEKPEEADIFPATSVFPAHTPGPECQSPPHCLAGGKDGSPLSIIKQLKAWAEQMWDSGTPPLRMGPQGSWLHHTHTERHLRDYMKNSSSQPSEKAVLNAVNSSPFRLNSPNSSGQWEEWGLGDVVSGLGNTMVMSSSFHKSEAGSERFLWVLESVLQADMFLIYSLRIAQNLKSQV